MRKTIAPSIIAKNQEEFDDRFSKVKTISQFFHLDVMDGKFVKTKSLNFDLTLPRKKYYIHLMVKNPEKYIEAVHSKAEGIIFHIESCKNDKEVEKIISLLRKRKKTVYIALNPKTSIKKIEPFIKKIDGILIMTVTPGKYGAKFLSKTLKKVKELREQNKKINIGVDGGINDKTIFLASKAGANIFIVGSYFQEAKDVRKASKQLKTKF